MKKFITLFILFSLTYSLSAQSFHTISIDSTNSGWTASETFTNCSSAYNAYFTWDANYIYFAVSDAEADYDNMATFMYFDTDPTGTGGTTNAYSWGDYITTPFKADYVVVWRNSSDYIEVMHWDSGASKWKKVAWVSSNSLSTDNYVVDFATGTDYREVRVKRTTIGSPVSVKFCSFTEQQWGSNWRYFAWPSDGWTDANRASGQSIPHDYGFILTDKISPNNGNYYDAWMYGWTGSTDNDWNTGSNWSGNSVPAARGLVTIESGTPAIDNGVSSPAQCFDLSISSGASLAIPPGKAMTIGNTLTNDATAADLTVSSDATGNGSLIVNGTVTGSTTVQRYIKQYSATENGWHEISSPVNDMAISGSDFAPGSAIPHLDDLYAWDESTNTWLNYKVSGNNITNFTNGEGYLVAYETTATKSFTGTLNTSDVSFSNLSYTDGQGHGWHLLGNPYASALKWGDANWSLNNVKATAKILNETSGNYDDVSSGGIIPSTNGFFIQVDSASSTNNSLTIPAADRTHDATNNYKAAQVQKETLRFKVTGDANSYYDVATLGFRSNATEDCDNAFDSHKLFTFVKTAPSLWTVSQKQDFSTNFLPETASATSVPLDFKPGVSGVHHLTVNGINSFDNTGLVLEDLKTGEKIDLSNTNSYDFSAEKSDDVNRFVLHINGVTAVPNVNKTDGIQVFAFGNTVYLHGQKALNGKVSIFNTLGQKVYDGLLNGAAKQQIRLSQRAGIYFVRVEENSHLFTRKVFIK